MRNDSSIPSQHDSSLLNAFAGDDLKPDLIPGVDFAFSSRDEKVVHQVDRLIQAHLSVLIHVQHVLFANLEKTGNF